MKKILAAVIAALVLTAGGLTAYTITGGRPVDPENKKDIYLEIPQGSTSSDIADKLENAGVIKSSMVFRIKAKIGGDAEKFQAGTYAFNKAMSTDRVIWVIANGKVAGKSFHTTQGQATYKIAKALEEKDICTVDEFFESCAADKFDYPFMDMLPKGENRFEGFLWPDSYNIPLKGGAWDAVNVMLKGFNDNVYEKYKDEISKKGLDFYKTIIKASVIEGEASDPEDMAKVSSVIDNRLKKGMMLQMDSTLNYIQKEDKVISSKSDTKAESAYNTYQHTGLPPGPICSPGENAVKAAIAPADTDYLFFVNSARLDGTLTFTKTEAEHNKAVKKFEKAYSEYQKKNSD